MSNPWNIRPTLAATVDLYVETTSEKAVCDRLGLSKSAVSTRLARAREEMGAKSRLYMALMWDRFKRGPHAG